MLTMRWRMPWLVCVVSALELLKVANISQVNSSSFVFELPDTFVVRGSDGHFIEFALNLKEDVAEVWTPVSACHSQHLGQGGAVSVQVADMPAMGTGASFGVSVQVLAAVLKATWGLDVAVKPARATTVTCLVNPGETVQVFVRARAVTFAPLYRLRVVDGAGQFSQPGEMVALPLRQAVARGDVACVSDRVRALQCGGYKFY